MKIPYVDLARQFDTERDEILACVEAVFRAGDFIAGADVTELERAVAEHIGTTHVVALNSGTDALILGLAALGVGSGDEVIVPPNSFIASAAAVAHIDATPVFVDVADDLNIDPERIDAAITPRTKAIMPVHLCGRIADMVTIGEIARRRGVAVLEDAAQAYGSKLNDTFSGTFGEVGCFSAHPLKNLNAAGDAGFLVTADADIAEFVRQQRSHGLINRNTATAWGRVSRMDTLQAAILLSRLQRLDDVIAVRRRNAEIYRNNLPEAHVFTPPCHPQEFNTFHTFVVQVDRRDALQTFLADRGIGSAIHYPVPLHLQPAAAYLGYARGAFPVAERQAGRILSLPIHQFLSEGDILDVCAAVHEFYET